MDEFEQMFVEELKEMFVEGMQNQQEKDLNRIEEMTSEVKELEVKEYNEALIILELALTSRYMTKKLDNERKEKVKDQLALQRSLMAEFNKFKDKAECLINIANDKLLKFFQENPDLVNIKTDLGKAEPEIKWEYELINSDEVPREFLIIDDVKIRQAINSGVRELPGLKINEINTLKLKLAVQDE